VACGPQMARHVRRGRCMRAIGLGRVLHCKCLRVHVVGVMRHGMCERHQLGVHGVHVRAERVHGG
jgi:hypothetical protein